MKNSDEEVRKENEGEEKREEVDTVVLFFDSESLQLSSPRVEVAKWHRVTDRDSDEDSTRDA